MHMGTKNSGNAAVKNLNKNKILKTIWDQDQISRADLSRSLGLCAATVSSSVDELCAEHYVELGETGSSSGGRKPVMVSIDNDTLHIAGLIVMKHRVLGSICGLKGGIVYSAEERMPIGTKDFMSVVKNVLDRLRDEWCYRGYKMIAIGIGMHGIVDYEKGISIFAPAFETHNINVKDEIEARYGLPVTVDNDVRGLLLAERWFGEHRKLRNYVYIGLGEGVGSGIMIDGRIIRGATSSAGEIGHLKVSDGGRRCACGNYGCLDTVASVKGIIWDAVQHIQMGYKSVLCDLAGNDKLGDITLDMLVKAADEGDELAKLVFKHMGMYVGKAAASIVNVLNPEAVVIGGTTACAWEHFKDELRETVHAQTISECHKNLKIVRTSFNANEVSLSGAALVVEKILETEE